MHELVNWASEHYGVGLLTNIMPGVIDAMRELGLLPNVTYDAIIDSSVVHAIKPEAKIYEVATAQAGRAGNEILLVDDTRTNLNAAEKCDWRVLWFDDYRAEESTNRLREVLEPAKGKVEPVIAKEQIETKKEPALPLAAQFHQRSPMTTSPRAW
jgi:FMN phosphatase YigB (HAD superfamily)